MGPVQYAYFGSRSLFFPSLVETRKSGDQKVLEGDLRFQRRILRRRVSSPFGVSFAMALFGEWAELANFEGLSDIRDFFHVQDDLWDAVSIHLGQMGEHIRLVAALPGSAITAACGLTVMPDGAALSPIQATQVGLVWRMARRITAFHAGTLEENFIDVDPWATSVTTQGRRTERR